MMYSATQSIFFNKFSIYVARDVMEGHLKQVVEQDWRRERQKSIRLK